MTTPTSCLRSSTDGVGLKICLTNCPPKSTLEIQTYTSKYINCYLLCHTGIAIGFNNLESIINIHCTKLRFYLIKHSNPYLNLTRGNKNDTTRVSNFRHGVPNR